MFTDDFIHGECNGRNMYDYDHDGDEYGCDSSPPIANLIGRLKFKTEKAALFELVAVCPYTEYPEDFKIGGEQWLPLSQITVSPLQTKYCQTPLPEELKDFERITVPLWLLEKFKSRFKGKIAF